MAVKSCRGPSWCFKRLRLVGQLGFLDGGNADIVAVEEIQQFSYFFADAGIDRSATKGDLTRVQKFWLSIVSVGDQAAKRQFIFGLCEHVCERGVIIDVK